MSKNLINEKLIKHLAGLVKINLDGGKDKLIKDLREIVNYFKELEEVDTTGVDLVNGGTDFKNVMRDDEYKDNKCLSNKRAKGNFPDKKNGYLKTPSVFNYE